MPWPMVHFAVTYKLSFSDPSPAFLLGSISPDAIHAREHVTRQDKGVTHFVREERFPSIETLQNACIEYLDKDRNAEWKEFILGYFAHIYTDIRWTETLYVDFEQQYSGDPAETRKTYHREVSQLEFDLLKHKAWAKDALIKLRQAHAFALDPFLTRDEVGRYRDSKIKWLQNNHNEPGIQNIYFQEGNANHFIENTANELKELFQAWGIDTKGE